MLESAAFAGHMKRDEKFQAEYWQSAEQFRYQAITGTYSACNFMGDLVSVRPIAEL